MTDVNIRIAELEDQRDRNFGLWQETRRQLQVVKKLAAKHERARIIAYLDGRQDVPIAKLIARLRKGRHT